jgi:hypothetical protein
MLKFFVQLGVMGVQIFVVRKFTCFMKTLLSTDHKIFDLLLVNADDCLEIHFGCSLTTRVSFDHRHTFTQGILHDCFIIDESV